MQPKSISNRNITLLRKLNQKKYRYQEQMFLIEGARAVQQIMENGEPKVKELFFDEKQQYWQQNRWGEAAKSMLCSTIAEDTFAEVSDTEHPQGVLALCRMPEEVDLEQLAEMEGLIVATDALQDPGNLGTIIRTASWFGVQGLLSGKGTVDLFHPKVVRSTAGATGTVANANVELHDALSFFEEEGWHVLLLDAGTDSIPLQEIKKEEKTVLVIGNEGSGIDASLFNSGRQQVQISSPAKDKKVESLNAAIAASIALYALA